MIGLYNRSRCRSDRKASALPGSSCIRLLGRAH
nr:MAG TPA: hypothetical protein [Caudoviricetes sp.]